MRKGDHWKIHADNHDFLPLRERAKKYVNDDTEQTT